MLRESAQRVQRLDAELVRRGLARSREQAVALIAAGLITGLVLFAWYERLWKGPIAAPAGPAAGLPAARRWGIP